MNKIYNRVNKNTNIIYHCLGKQWRILFLLSFYITLLCLHTSEAQFSYARKENNIWLGKGFTNGQPSGAGLDFNSGSPQPVWSSWMGTYAVVDQKGSASVSDANGHLLFYTDGTVIWDRNNNVMQGGWDINNNGNMVPGYSYIDPLWGVSAFTRDGVVIMPVPGSSHKYYVFSIPFIYPPGINVGCEWQGKLFCTVVDMELNNGLGAVDAGFRGVEIADSMAGNLQGVVGDNCDYWLAGFGSQGDYEAFNITAEGIHTTPVVSTLAPPLDPFVCELNVSPDRHKAAMAISSEVQVTDFDPATGLFSNDFLIGAQGGRFVAFSPNSQLLYISGIIGVRQYDLSNLSTPFTLLMMNNYTDYEFDSPLRLGPDGKIYLAYYGPVNGVWSDYYSSFHPVHIQAPDVFGTSCQMELMSGSFPFLEQSVQSLPQEIPVIVYDTVSEVREAPICFHKPPVLSPGVDGTDYHWMVNTIGTTFVRKGNDSTDTLLATDPGIYAVQYYTSNPCTLHRDTFIVKDINYSLYLGPDQLSCDGGPVSLDAGDIAGATYLWQDGSIHSKLEADTSGLYWVEVDKQGCTARDSITVTIMAQQDLGEDTLVCIEDAVHILLHAHVPPGAIVLWSTGATTPSIQAQDSGLYWVQVNYADCSVSDSMYIHAEYCDCAVLFPSAFSPNGDGVNDRFSPVAAAACPITDYRMEIYNRWGQRVFVSFNADETWDGTFNGKPADAGTYMYRVQGRVGLRYTVMQQQGDVTLIR